MKIPKHIRPYAKRVYNSTIRGYLPKGVQIYNGIPAKGGRVLDSTIQRRGYKQGSIRQLRERVRAGDEVIVVGGGFGITPAVAARQGAHVTCYEAGEEYAEIVRETAYLNTVEDRINVIHASVGPVFSGLGDGVDRKGIDPSEMPEADVIELDCEGAEGEILYGLDFHPRVAIVEAHPQHGVIPQSVEEWFDERDYEIVDIYEHDSLPNVTLTGVKK